MEMEIAQKLTHQTNLISKNFTLIAQNREVICIFTSWTFQKLREYQTAKFLGM